MIIMGYAGLMPKRFHTPHGRKGVDRIFLGSSAEAIVRSATCTVLTVGPDVSDRQDADLAVLHALITSEETQEMKELLPQNGGAGKAEFFVERGNAATVILQYANKLRPKLLVMGFSEKNKASTHFRRGGL